MTYSLPLFDTFYLIDWTRLYQTKIERVLPGHIHNELQTSNNYNLIKAYFESAAYTSYTRYRQNGKLQSRIDKLNNLMNKSFRSLKQIGRQIIKYIINICDNQWNLNDVLLDLIKRLFKFQTQLKNQIIEYLNDIWVVKHNKLLKDVINDCENGIANAIQSVTNYTTRSQYQTWRYKVWYMIITFIYALAIITFIYVLAVIFVMFTGLL